MILAESCGKCKYVVQKCTSCIRPEINNKAKFLIYHFRMVAFHGHSFKTSKNQQIDSYLNTQTLHQLIFL